MKTSTEFIGALAVLAVVVGVAFAPLDGTMRLLLAAVAITVGGGIMAFLRSRKPARR